MFQPPTNSDLLTSIETEEPSAGDKVVKSKEIVNKNDFVKVQFTSDVLNIFYDDDIVELLWGKKYNTALRRYKEPGLAR